MRKLAILFALSVLAVGLTLAGVYVLARPAQRTDVRAGLSLAEALNNPASAQFARVLGPRDFRFPTDHGPHSDYGIEWWYFTGNLETRDSRHFGYELTLFRIGLAPEPSDGRSDWGASQVFMGHFALTDVEDDRFYAFERFSRVALGLAGAVPEGDGFRIWLEDWSVQLGGGQAPSVRLVASQEGIALDLSLSSAKPLVLQGQDGMSRKSEGDGNASYYYSVTRMPTSGVVSIAGEHFAVQGSSWMDREWSTTALADDQVGWDWFALQLSDGRDLMYYQLRRRGGEVDPFSSGSLVQRDGAYTPLAPDDVRIDVLDTWRSPRGIEYPSRWRLSIPSAGLELEIIPYMSNQELDVSVTYWEGAVRVSGTGWGLPIKGQGYVEMTGYDGESGGRS